MYFAVCNVIKEQDDPFLPQGKHLGLLGSHIHMRDRTFGKTASLSVRFDKQCGYKMLQAEISLGIKVK